jgi:hypothetical protein
MNEWSNLTRECVNYESCKRRDDAEQKKRTTTMTIRKKQTVQSVHTLALRLFTMKKNHSKKPATSSDTADPQPQDCRQPWGLTKTLIVVIGGCCVVSAFVNILHAHNTTHGTAVHQAMKEFLEETPNMIQRKSNGPPQSAVEAIDTHNQAEDEEEPPERGHHYNEEEHQTNANGVPSTRAHLSCAKHGGPEDEFAQEMVYWQDIPSDARYVSPFHSKHGQEKRYMVRWVAPDV